MLFLIQWNAIYYSRLLSQAKQMSLARPNTRSFPALSDTFQTFYHVTNCTFPDASNPSSKSFRSILHLTAIQAVCMWNFPSFPCWSMQVENGESLDYPWHVFHRVFLQTKENIYLLQYIPNVKNWDHSEICYP